MMAKTKAVLMKSDQHSKTGAENPVTVAFTFLRFSVFYTQLFGENLTTYW